MSVPTPIELRATLVTLVAGVTETRAGRWEELIGKVELLSLALHPGCNWRIKVVAAAEDDRKVLDAAIELLRREHPYASLRKSPGA